MASIVSVIPSESWSVIKGAGLFESHNFQGVECYQRGQVFLSHTIFKGWQSFRLKRSEGL